MKGHRAEQLACLKAAGAVTRETAVATLSHGELRPVTLSRMASEGLVFNAYLPFNGDARRRLSHYWLSPQGIEAAQ